ncbi:MAG: asparagine synthase (glutamine-hydrolyzing) [Elusimicrobia bacterium]|nr:asparagine synthase (glutamine-hydrolyzing) [Elusimicrobiota bacterium]
MCGIAGFFKLKGAPGTSPENSSALIQAMTRTMTHRGPDDEGYLLTTGVCLGMRRLNIIDLETGRQPLFNEDKSVAVVFNGEIYNYLELREELKKKGHRFETASDTEVLAHLYEEEGETFPRRLRGMFAFALWDAKKRRLLLGRDHFGIKPLFWGIFGNELLFGSEIKALHPHPAFKREINNEAIDDFLTLLFIPTPKTIYQNLHKLEPGTILAVNQDGTTRKVRYWDAGEVLTKSLGTRLNRLEEIEEMLSAKISECVKMMLRSDVPLGVFLSGGLDSTTTAYFASRHNPNVKTFNVFFKEKSYSEREGALATAKKLGTDHHEIPMEYPEDLAGFAWGVLGIFDEPFGDTSALPTYLLCGHARRHITVALSGDGGDELFGGYPTTIATRAISFYRHLPGFLRAGLLPFLAKQLPTSLERVSWDYKIKRFILSAKDVTDPLAAHFGWRSALYWFERELFYSPSFYNQVSRRKPFADLASGIIKNHGVTLADQAMFGDLSVYLLDLYLVKADMSSMANSLEMRPSLLDPELAELALRIPPHFKIRGFQTKWIIRHMMEGKLPQEVLGMPKKGFTPPLSYWLLQKDFQDFVRQAVSSQVFRNLGVFKDGVVDQLLTEHAAKKNDHTRRLWAILSLASFAEKNQRAGEVFLANR